MALGVLAEFAELVGVAHVVGHGRGDELLREVRLQIGRLVGDVGVGRRVRLVEAVFGELGAGIEDGVGEALGDALFGGAFKEAIALGGHFGLDLLAHGATQQIGLGERVAGERAGDLLDLLLIGDDAVGGREDGLEQRVEIFDVFAAGLAGAIGRNVRHRARAVERDERDEVLEAIGAHVDERALHARTFHLEHAQPCF